MLQTSRNLAGVGASTPSGPFPLGEVVQLLSQCHRKLRRMLADRLSRWDLNDIEFLVLWLCHQASERGLAQHDLAEALGVSAAHMSGLVERLRSRGLLAGRRCRLDRRRQLWFPDTAGARLLIEIGQQLDELAASLGRSIGLPQQQLLAALLRSLAAADEASPTLRLFDPDREDDSSGREASDARSPESES